MKHFLQLTFLLLTGFIQAQIQNISELSTGVHERTSILSDTNHNVIGYAFIFNKGLINNQKDQQFEYVILDKNLYKLTNGTFDLKYHKKFTNYFNSISFNNQKLYISGSLINHQLGVLIGQLFLKIDLKSNAVEENFLNTQGARQKTYDLDYFTKSRNIPSSYGSDFILPYFGTDQHYYVEYNKILGKDGLNFFKFYDRDFKDIFEYNPSPEQVKQGVVFEPKSLKGDNIVIFKQKKSAPNSSKIESDSLMMYHFKHDSIIYKVAYHKNGSQGAEYAEPKTEFIGENLAVLGEIKKIDSQSTLYLDQKPSLGLRRTIYSNKGEVLLNKNIYYNDILADLSFKDGRDKNGYKFIMTEFFNYNDHSFSVLLEKQKGDGLMVATKTTDYIVLNFDADGQFKNHYLLEKSKNKYETYMFSQENKAENEVLFFYQEELKEGGEKNYYLVINRLKDGQLTQQKMPFKTKSSSMRFSKAKFGYILVSEYNKEDKESEVRIEKLNFD